ncbi:hypothetical protein [Enterococcus faecium]|uniref:hypothetical protein n=1 Tax=Enterococcus faecium TaxID=1352 RepID=UPI001123342C|nr:hypothetical protein [Enterococcus faecium]EME8217085.1 hypothetical protein [Enterococcus faecium]TNW82877.1 hypothetical protein FIU58_10340 [Enterococcus faecium]
MGFFKDLLVTKRLVDDRNEKKKREAVVKASTLDRMIIERNQKERAEEEQAELIRSLNRPTPEEHRRNLLEQEKQFSAMLEEKWNEGKSELLIAYEKASRAYLDIQSKRGDIPYPEYAQIVLDMYNAKIALIDAGESDDSRELFEKRIELTNTKIKLWKLDEAYEEYHIMSEEEYEKQHSDLRDQERKLALELRKYN